MYFHDRKISLINHCLDDEGTIHITIVLLNFTSVRNYHLTDIYSIKRKKYLAEFVFENRSRAKQLDLVKRIYESGFCLIVSSYLKLILTRFKIIQVLKYFIETMVTVSNLIKNKLYTLTLSVSQ